MNETISTDTDISNYWFMIFFSLFCAFLVALQRQIAPLILAEIIFSEKGNAYLIGQQVESWLLDDLINC